MAFLLMLAALYFWWGASNTQQDTQTMKTTTQRRNYRTQKTTENGQIKQTADKSEIGFDIELQLTIIFFIN